MNVEELQRKLAVELGEALKPEWVDPFTAVPRHEFLPDQALWSQSALGPNVSIDRQADPQGWLEAAYSNAVIVTQMDADGVYTSSASEPFMVFRMLSLLVLLPGHKVLEIGTGTGWSSGLMCSQVGDDNVVSIEVDRDVAERARLNLQKLGFAPMVITGDGAEGFPIGVPYDRVIATCSVHRVPFAWIAQCQHGGKVVAPWRTAYDSGAIVQLHVNDDRSASGRFVLGSAFMTLRAQQFHAVDEPDDFEEKAEVSALQGVDLNAMSKDDPSFAIGLLVPGVKRAYTYSGPGVIETLWLLSDDSWASVHEATTVRQHGKRHLWDEVVAAYGWWLGAGSPEVTRFGLTVSEQGQRVWLDTQDRLVFSN